MSASLGLHLVVTADHECGGLTIEGPDNSAFPDESGGNEGDENANLSVEEDEDGAERLGGSGHGIGRASGGDVC